MTQYQHELIGNDNAQISALQAFRGSLDLLCAALRAQGIPTQEIAQILVMQGSAVIDDGDPDLADELAKVVNRSLPVPRDL